MTITIAVPDSAFIKVIRNMYEQGEITIEQYAGCLRRAQVRQDNQIEEELK